MTDYNENASECKWPYSIRGGPVSDCNFPIKDVPTDLTEFAYNKNKPVKMDEFLSSENVKLVVIPKNTMLLHGVLDSQYNRQWWVNSKPESEYNVVWFTSDNQHILNINATHILVYETNKNLLCLYEQNLRKKYGQNVRGYEYSRILRKYITRVANRYNILINGYVGCNECEIGLTNETAADLVGPKSVIDFGTKYIN